ncbi:MAG: AmmeMemoRadiSam system protein B, partial [Candidatus Aminicenantes bacterium]
MTVVALIPAAGQGLRPAAFAGSFYPAEPAQLAAEIEGYLAAAAPISLPSGKILALIVPHAGYIYSGRTAAAAYALVRNRPIETVVIIGPSHRVAFE